jgi:hypothetical protein
VKSCAEFEIGMLAPGESLQDQRRKFMNSRRLVPAIFCLCVSAGVAGAATFSFAGTFTHDDQFTIFLFTAPSASVTVRTWSYAGGTDAAGQLIAPGGFDPILSVFDATGGLTAGSLLLANNNDGAGVATDLGNGFDSLLLIPGLSAGGTYAVVLSQNDNAANGPVFGSGFVRDGQGNFTPGAFGCLGTSFCDSSANQRNGNWEVDILGVGSATIQGTATTPEPTSILLSAAGIAGLALLRRRMAQSQ